ncbi:UDP-glucose/GDP-mannose dehydrogenase family protein [Bacillus sp. 3255]|uniref:UDP-glucose dehydrogenase family protein n=1 Tax=Bacillus sp. 3255 TaxID=2817904 RepID=UPI0028607D40|nr:UDP-glucose/GDP-mannose dehydrogenase family protein [Bacillus sp. 3255]MDR6881999.1 UDPglucose 6-dehydrogenase [Bacillus sp. 3255]
MRLTIVGTGYVGLVAAVCLAKLGHEVIAVDRESIIRGLMERNLHVWEPQLETELEACCASGRLHFETDLLAALADTDALMIAVGTPTREDGHTNLSYVYEVLAHLMQSGVCPPLVIVKSTVPVGTCDELEESLHAAGLRTEVAFNPEFLRQGSAVRDFIEPDRIVLGCKSAHAEAQLRELYEGIEAPVYVCDRRSAELVKYASNAFLAMKISFANMMSDVCEGYGADIRDVMHGVGADRRIGPEFLQAGVGYGGSCFSKDLKSLLTSGKLVGSSLPLLEATAKINDQRIPRLIAKLISLWDSPMGKRLCVLGISFKPQTNDVRDAPFLTLLAQCKRHGIEVRAYDPVIRQVAKANVDVVDSPYAAAAGADAVMIMTEWPQFAELDWPYLLHLMRRPLVLDGRNQLPGDVVSRLMDIEGAVYMPIGRPMERQSHYQRK